MNENKEAAPALSPMQKDILNSLLSITDALIKKELLTREELTESAQAALTSIKENDASIASCAQYDFPFLHSLASPDKLTFL